MTQLAKQLMCIQMRSGVEIWVEKERVETLQDILTKITGSKFITFDDQTINTADIVGIFAANTMEAHTRRKNGQWQCSVRGEYHDRGEKCECVTEETEYKNLLTWKNRGVKLDTESERRLIVLQAKFKK